MIIIGLTGPTGAGKSSLTEIAEAKGFKVIDCDKTARKATEKGTEALNAVVSVFGDDILFENGELNRKALAEKAFKNRESTELLNKTLLPFIVKLVKAECNSERVLLDAPTLFESGLDNDCDATISVLANTKIRLERIVKRDNISKEAALLRINAGKSEDFYKQNSDYILYNNGNVNEFQKNFEQILNLIKEK